MKTDQRVVLRPATPDLDILEYRVLSVRDVGHLEDRCASHAAVGSWEFTERPFEDALTKLELGFDDDLAIREDVDTVAGIRQPDRRSHHRRGISIFGLVVADWCCCEQRDAGLFAEHDGDLERPASAFSCAALASHVLPRAGPQAEEK